MKFLRKVLGSNTAMIAAVLSAFAVNIMALVQVSSVPNGLWHLTFALLFGAALIFFGMMQGIMACGPQENPGSKMIVLFWTWVLYRFTGMREVDMTALPQFIEDGRPYRGVPLSFHLAKDGVPILTQAMVPLTDEEVTEIEGEQWRK